MSNKRRVKIRATWAEATYLELQIAASQQRISRIAADPARLAAFNGRQAETRARLVRRQSRRSR